MPSRPVLIGRGLVTQTLNNHYKHTYQSEPRKRTTTVRVHIHHTPQHPAKNGHQGCVNQQLNTHMLGHPVTTPGCDHKSYGGHSERETPGPIPNPEVKPFSADGTATERLWESRTPPDILSSRATPSGVALFRISGHVRVPRIVHRRVSDGAFHNGVRSAASLSVPAASVCRGGDVQCLHP